jgi:alpha-tubulin suppressor-like RCC1 family protein
MDHFVALDSSGFIWTMGDDTLGQCGLGAFNRATGGPFYERRVRKPERVESKKTKFK